MIGALARRGLLSALVLWAVVTLTFGILRFIPGGPFDSDKALPADVLRNVERAYHLDESLARQYVRYWRGLLRGDLGPSYKYRTRDVRAILADTFPVSAALGALAFCLAVGGGIGLGALAALGRGGPGDRALMLVATAGVSVPSFVLGALLVYGVGLRLGWLPVARLEGPSSLVLPALTLAAAPTAYLARLARAAFLDVLGEDFIRAARAKGVGPVGILAKHALKNAMIPLLSVMGPLLAALLTGSFVVEQIFALPGMGRYFITAVTNRDYPLVMGVTLVYSVLLIVANGMVDVAYLAVDPRIRAKARS
ncbi:MAG: ABC transporter permease [Myxococcales bacterium]|nr:ABC transporter permease [Myxococcales bacterium]